MPAEEIELTRKPEFRVAEGEALQTRDLTCSERFGHAYHRLLVSSDVIALITSSAFALLVGQLSERGTGATGWAVTTLILIPVWVIIAHQLGLYRQVERRLNFDYVTELMPIVAASTFWCWMFILLRELIFGGETELISPVIMWASMMLTLLCFRSLARSIAHTRPWFKRSVALIGDVATVKFLETRINRHPEWGLSIGLKAIRQEDNSGWNIRRPSRDGGPERMSTIDQVEGPGLMAFALSRLVTDAHIDRAMVAGGLERLSSRTELIHTMLDAGIAVDSVSGGPETLYATAMPQHLEGISFLSSHPTVPRPLDVIMKRAIDIVMSSVLIVVTAPLLAFAAFRIKRDSPGPVFFRQQRTGLNEEIFEIVKLRTMYVGSHQKRSELRAATASSGNDDVLFKLDDDPRVTKCGRWLRRTSLDELPQLISVLKGDMSMVGPRPLVPEEAQEAHGLYRARFRVKPGVAGAWQAEGRSGIPFEDMLRLDYSYVAGWSMGEDLRLMLRTFSAVIARSGAK